MMERKLRLSREEDLPRMIEIMREAKAYMRACNVDQWQSGYPDEAIFRADIENGCGYVLECDGEVGGFAAICFGGEPDYLGIFDGAWVGQEPYACVHRVAVAGKLRGTGAARFIFAEAEKIALENGVRVMRVDTHEDNLTMQGMLARCGYEKRGKIMISAGKEAGTERVALEKIL